MNRKNTSWQKVNKWYGKIVGDEGHYYHQNVIMPRVLEMLELDKARRIIDIACGNGFLANKISPTIEYFGVDLAEGLIKQAREKCVNKKAKFIVGDVSKGLKVDGQFDRGVIILALQNIKEPEKVIKNCSGWISKNGKLVIVINHPCFRIPRQSSWETDQDHKLQYRRVNKYMSRMEIPINMNPSDKNSELTWSYHWPIESLSKMFYENGFLIKRIEEWTSDKESAGSAAKMENRARNEFPLFMAFELIRV